SCSRTNRTDASSHDGTATAQGDPTMGLINLARLFDRRRSKPASNKRWRNWRLEQLEDRLSPSVSSIAGALGPLDPLGASTDADLLAILSKTDAPAPHNPLDLGAQIYGAKPLDNGVSSGSGGGYGSGPSSPSSSNPISVSSGSGQGIIPSSVSVG